MSIILGPYLGRLGIKAAFSAAAPRSTLRQLGSAATQLSNSTIRTHAAPVFALIPTNTTNSVLDQHLQRSQRRIGHARAFFSGGVITNYVELPADYTDEVGLPFRVKGLQGHEVVSIFGSSLSTARANKLLRILHGRRVAGTLDDPAYYENTKTFGKYHIRQALEYLRKTVPVDELINAGLRAEEELQRLEEEEADGAGEGQPRPKNAPSSTPAEKWTRRLFKERPIDDPYGESSFDRIRANREARWEEELKRREEERAQKEAEEAARNPGGLAKIDKNAPLQPSPKMQARIKAAQSDLKEPPKMSAVARLWKTYYIVFAVLGLGSFYVNYVYEPPTRDERIFPNSDPATVTASALVAATVVVYCWWKTPALWPILNRYFILTSATPRGAAVFGAILSHQNFAHLAFNAPALFFLTQALHHDVGRSETLQTFAAGGSLGFLASLTHMTLLNRLHLSTLGASGAIYAVGAAYFWMYKFEGFKIFGFPPDPYNGIQGLGFLGLAVGGHLVALMGKRMSQTDLVSHMAGMAVGIVYGEWFCMKKRERIAAYREGREERGLWELLVERVKGGVASPAR